MTTHSPGHPPVGSFPVEAGSVIDRLAHWCAHDCLQQEDSVREALAICEEALHALPDGLGPGEQAPFRVGAVATLVCAVQSQIDRATRSDP
ncbi:MAG: hypothetical protein ER33_03790 [Cyanobium sp. CACIAM 14]|nr:MAG: hypothetical protein ER33_03790 [Cyanobium sp. CACIAM 14]